MYYYKYYRFYVTANWFMDNGYSDSDTLFLIELVLNVDNSPTALPSNVPSTTPSVTPSDSPSATPSIHPRVRVFSQLALTNPISGATYDCSGQIDNTSTPCSNAFDNGVNSGWSVPINSTYSPYAVITLSSPMIVTSYQLYMLGQEDAIGEGGYR